MSPPRPPRRPGGGPGQNAATFLALLGLLLLAGGLLGLTAMVMPSMLGILVVLCGFVGFGLFHYLMWGWWLSGIDPPEEDG